MQTKIIFLSAKSSLILGENKAAFRRECHINVDGNAQTSRISLPVDLTIFLC